MKLTGQKIKLWLRRAFFALVIVCAIPLVLTPIYALGFIHPVSTLMISRLASFSGYERSWVDIEDVAPILYQTVLMSEDGQFCRHYGIDLGELRAVVENALEGEETRGASTITMQTAKNLFLWGGRSYFRKAVELPLAVWIDLVLPKKRIMEIYLNIAEWGPDGQFGIAAASIHHFGKHPADLTAREAALLAVTLPNPIERNPAKPSNHMASVAKVVQKRASQSGGYVECLN